MITKKRYGVLIVVVPFLLLIFSFSIASKDKFSIKVRKGDTISYLAFKYLGAYNERVVNKILEINPNIKNVDSIKEGDLLVFPRRETIDKPSVSIIEETKTQGEKAVITYLQGKGQALKKDREKWQDANVNMMLYSGDKVKVFPQSRMELTLDSRNIIRLNENSILHLKKMRTVIPHHLLRNQ